MLSIFSIFSISSHDYIDICILIQIQYADCVTTKNSLDSVLVRA